MTDILPEFDFTQLRLDRKGRLSYINDRDCLDLMNQKMTKIALYVPTEDEARWLDRQLRRYCGHYFPALGLFRAEKWLFASAREYYRMLRSQHTFGMIYLIVVGNISPMSSIDLLCSDMTRQHLVNHYPDFVEKMQSIDFECFPTPHGEPEDADLEVMIDEIEDSEELAGQVLDALDNDERYNQRFAIYRGILLRYGDDASCLENR